MHSNLGFKATFGNLNGIIFLRKVIQVLIQSNVPIKEVTIENTETLPMLEEQILNLFNLNQAELEQMVKG